MLDSVRGRVFDLAGAESFEVLSVEGEQVVLFGLEADHFGGYVLERAKQFAVAAGDEGGIGARELDVDLASLEVVGVGGARAGGDAGSGA